MEVFESRPNAPVSLSRRSVVVDGPLAFRVRRFAAVRARETGLQICTLPMLAARLAGGFVRPAMPTELEGAVRDALAIGGLVELESMRHLPGMTRAVVSTLRKVWLADIRLNTLSHSSARILDLATIERRVRDALPPGVLTPIDLRDAAMLRLRHASAVLGSVELERVDYVAQVWRPLVHALGDVVSLHWIEPATSETKWFPGRISAKQTVPSAREIVSCADPRAEVVESLRWARELVATSTARPEEIAICAASTDTWDDHFLTLTKASDLPLHFSNGVPALSTRNGQACAALADVLTNGLSQDRIRRLFVHSAGKCETLRSLPFDWATGLRPEASLLHLEQ